MNVNTGKNTKDCNGCATSHRVQEQEIMCSAVRPKEFGKVGNSTELFHLCL